MQYVVNGVTMDSNMMRFARDNLIFFPRKSHPRVQFFFQVNVQMLQFEELIRKLFCFGPCLTHTHF